MYCVGTVLPPGRTYVYPRSFSDTNKPLNLTSGSSSSLSCLGFLWKRLLSMISAAANCLFQSIHSLFDWSSGTAPVIPFFDMMFSENTAKGDGTLSQMGFFLPRRIMARRLHCVKVLFSRVKWCTFSCHGNLSAASFYLTHTDKRVPAVK